MSEAAIGKNSERNEGWSIYDSWQDMPTTVPQHELVNQALAHHRAGRLDDAERIYRQVLAVDPAHADALHLLGMAAFQTGRLDLAVEMIQRAIAAHPNAASYHSNLGNVLQAQDKLQEAVASYKKALALRPGIPETHLNLGNVLRELGDVDGALSAYRRAIELKPDLADAQVAESTTLLLQGDFSRGWTNFELRWRTQDYDTPLRAYPQPLWSGEALPSGRLLVWGEQGIGDEIMFAGLLPDLIKTRIPLALECDRRLAPLFARSFPGVAVISSYNPAKNSDLEVAAHLPSGSLPRFFRSSRAAFDATTSPYLIADPVEREKFRAQYGDVRATIGIAWRTRNAKSGRKRSIDLGALAPLFADSRLRWISLQYGDHAELEAEARAADAPVAIDRSVDQLEDIDRFAAQAAAMDLVLTIDNSTAHLAAALGIPTWLLLPFAPDWRWMLASDRRPWYPTMRIFRQPQRGDWASVARAVRAALAGHIAPASEK
jgi:cytochrome c-type biogenesis protein CcmH/NrfG